VRQATYIIAEAGVNHNGSLQMARQLVDAAADAGADAVKFQTFKAKHLVTTTAPKAEYQKITTEKTESQYEMLKNLELSDDEHFQLLDYCKLRGITFLSTPFDLESVDLLTDKLNLPLLKISSGDITNAPLLLKAARSGVSIILSTGMSTLSEIETALGVLAFGYTETNLKPSITNFQQAFASETGKNYLTGKVSLLHCTTEYPTPFEDINLLAMDVLKEIFLLPVGLSDHSVGISIPIAAAARNAAIIEKHFTLDRTLPGPDHKASLEPVELKDMVRAIREVEAALGTAAKIPVPGELSNLSIARKSIVAARDIQQGEVLSEHNLVVKRPGDGVAPIYYWDYIGKLAPRNYSMDEKVEL
jgi:N-acetylneuraminate synthase